MPSFDESEKHDKSKRTLEKCPHCGVRLSRWEQVLLSVDRALMCKNCWYRIILDLFENDEDKEK